MSQASALLEKIPRLYVLPLMKVVWSHQKASGRLFDHAGSMLMSCGAFFQYEEPTNPPKEKLSLITHQSCCTFMTLADTPSKIETSDVQNRILK